MIFMMGWCRKKELIEGNMDGLSLLGIVFIILGAFLILLGIKYKPPKGVGMEVNNIRYIGSGVLFIMGGMFILFNE